MSAWSRRPAPVAVVALAVVVGTAFAAGPEEDYVREVEEWRAARDESLRAPGSWLSVVGLHWLEPGRTRFGSAGDNDLVLPASAPAHAGEFEFRQGRTRVSLAEGVVATVAGTAVSAGRELRPDSEGEPDFLVLGDVSLQVIRRGGRYAIRTRDAKARARLEFQGRKWYPVDPRWRIDARFVAHARARTLRIQSAVGTVERMESPGYAEFEVGGATVRLTAVLESDSDRELFYIFRDETSGKETYSGGRFLYSEPPHGGRVTLDLNKAYSPPCAFTRFATCPLPPPENWLRVRIEAGELAPAGH